MNCRIGDLARVVKMSSAYTDRLVDVVRLLGLAPEPFSQLGPMWYVRPIGFTPPDCDLTDDGLFLLPDFLLRPIRDPGDDATDEMLLIAGKPCEVAA